MIKAYSKVISETFAQLEGWNNRPVFMALDLDNVPALTKTVRTGIVAELRKVDIARDLHVNRIQLTPATDTTVVSIPLTVDTYDVNVSFAMPTYEFNEDTEKEPRTLYIETLLKQRDLIIDCVAKRLNV